MEEEKNKVKFGLGGIIGTIFWAILWGIVAYAEYGENTFWFGMALGFVMPIITLLGIIPFLGVYLYMQSFDWIVDKLLIRFGVTVGITTSILYWLGVVFGSIMSLLAVFLIIEIIRSR